MVCKRHYVDILIEGLGLYWLPGNPTYNLTGFFCIRSVWGVSLFSSSTRWNSLRQLHNSIYNKRDDFNFHITNFMFLSSNITSSPAIVFLSLNLYDTPELAPRVNVSFWGPGDFSVSYSYRDTLWDAWNRHSGSFMVVTRILFSNMKSPSHECYMIFWPLTNSDFSTDQSFHQFHDINTELELHRIMSGFHWAFATGVACEQGTLTLPDSWFLPPFWVLLVLQLLRLDSSSLSCLYSTFQLWYFLGFASSLSLLSL